MAGLDVRQQWEYLDIPVSRRDRLDDLGREGWELIAIVGERGDEKLYLKRPLPSFRERVTLEQRASYYRARGLDPGPRAGRRSS